MKNINILQRIRQGISSIFSLINEFFERIFEKHEGIRHEIKSKGSCKPIDANKEFHRVLVTIKDYAVSIIDRGELKSSMMDHLESLTFIEDNLDQIFPKKQDPEIKNKIRPIIKWCMTTTIKVIDDAKKGYFTEDDFESMLIFLHESIWKLIIIFEDVLGIRCRLCENKKRELHHPFYKEEEDTSILDDEQFKKDLKKMINKSND